MTACDTTHNESKPRPAHAHVSWGTQGCEANLCRECVDELWRRIEPLAKAGDPGGRIVFASLPAEDRGFSDDAQGVEPSCAPRSLWCVCKEEQAMSKHTPGPWQRYGYIGEAGLARVRACVGKEERTGRALYKDVPVTAADSLLIAAAPDMYAALESIAEYWNGNHNDTAMADACEHAVETALEALKKAKGDA
jgi:hypothetical protein